MEPHDHPRMAPHRHWAYGSFALVVVAGIIYFIAAPQPVPDVKQGAIRATAVERGGQPKPASDTDAAVKIIGASADGSKPCDEQTWPYIEKDCLKIAEEKIAEDKPAKAKSGNSTPLGLRDMLAGVRPAPAVETSIASPARDLVNQPIGSVTAIAPTPSVKDMEANTVGAASSDTSAAVTDGVATTESLDVPLPPARPEIAQASHPDSQSVDDADTPAPPLSRAEQRRRDRELERERRHAAREIERERRRLERAKRRADNSNRIVRRWTEYSHDDGSRTVVIEQGSPRDRFFRTYR